MIGKFLKSFIKTVLQILVFSIIFLGFNNSVDNRDSEIRSSLMAKVLYSNISLNYEDTSNLSFGYANTENEIIVNQDKLIQDFFYVNESTENRLDQNHISALILVYYDRYIIYDPYLSKWQAPVFFTYNISGNQYYLNTQNNTALNNQNSSFAISSLGLAEEEKNQIIIDKINTGISKFTSDEYAPLQLKIRNASITDGDYLYEYNTFNVIDDVTFLVVYKKASLYDLLGNLRTYKNYTITGYTIK
ncbi:MAG: hypothetical protein BGO41_01510 [Clostridiales bacterium 38-18]|nr:MAG: hypothetical protein BGO41_01510 [Clostridiales bacterium 38-18]